MCEHRDRDDVDLEDLLHPRPVHPVVDALAAEPRVVDQDVHAVSGERRVGQHRQLATQGLQPVPPAGGRQQAPGARRDRASELAPDPRGCALAVQLWTALHGAVDLRISKPEMPWPPIEALVDATLHDLRLHRPAPGRARARRAD